MGSEALRSLGKTTVFLSWFDIFMPRDFTIWCLLFYAGDSLLHRGVHMSYPCLIQRWHFQDLGDGIQCLSYVFNEGPLCFTSPSDRGPWVQKWATNTNFDTSE